ncbi:MAG: DUF2721 domain-containing protein [Alphaproteobacteria bacterium]|nr:DUF2721 domain-containing protein [Alphaproteobacteria bacterium]
MALSNPFVLLSYVGGPALLTNATGLFILSTSNRFARAVDRARFLADRLSGEGSAVRPHFRMEMPEVQRRVLLMGRALACFYVAASAFAIATLASIAAAVLTQEVQGAVIRTVYGLSLTCGGIGFCAFIAGAALLSLESRTAVRSLAREYAEAIAHAARKDV